MHKNDKLFNILEVLNHSASLMHPPPFPTKTGSNFYNAFSDEMFHTLKNFTSLGPPQTEIFHSTFANSVHPLVPTLVSEDALFPLVPLPRPPFLRP